MKRIIAIILTICLAFTTLTSGAEENKYAYLEDMPVKELKELRDAINELLGDSDVGTTSASGFGTLTGTITYYYNQYKGHVPDTESTIIMVKNDAENLDINTNGLGMIQISGDSHDFGDGVYSTQVNGNGVFTIGHIPEGEYFALIVSGQTSGSSWFDCDTDAEKEEYYKSIGSGWEGRLKEEDATAIGRSVVWLKYKFQKISIYGGETTTFDYDFGTTYI